MLEIAQGPAGVSIHSRYCRISFQFEKDRWHHRIEFGLPMAWQPFAGALEQDPNDNVSEIAVPTFQDLRVEGKPDSAHVLALGKSGAHYFSGDFFIRELESPNATITVIDVDIAHRCLHPFRRLSYAYELAAKPAAPAAVCAGLRAAAWSLEGGNASVILEAGGRENDLCFAELLHGASPADWGIRIDAVISTEKVPNHRLRYTWRHDAIPTRQLST
jgi:hypothetical protein